ncbi:hypothetical protein Poli38472_009116 [Pythium oligandrum]|uniref:Uncharacterized protein n=1 Tax=Pythium oligandrum TaxID=41045 RepID=A0A8K1FL71_PYTOL|nr:hypothetical protein Poli38472_009116 [Pythium oligandrum]|eukprot:TMW64949.1 hypothetical protein Poli38472_009116 [Pythium oligandrum]
MDEYVSGDTRGAHLQLAQRHKKIEAGHFRGHKRFEPEAPHPGVVGQVALSFTTSGVLTKESRVTCVLPDHGWGFASTVHAVLRLPQGMPTSVLKTVWNGLTRTLEFKLLDEEIPADTPVLILIAAVSTPESATSTAEAVVTSYEKLVVRNTVPPSTRGGQIIDGPTTFTIPKIRPGELGGVRKWQPFSYWPSARSEVTVSFRVHGRIPANGRIRIELPTDGWDMDDSPKVFVRTSEYPNQPLTATWSREQNTLEVSVDSISLKAGTSVILVVDTVKNPAAETPASSAARVTTLVASGSVIDGPTRIDVARISELRESDFEIAKLAFQEVTTEDASFVTVDKLPDLFKRTGIVLPTELFGSVVVANLPVQATEEGDGVQSVAAVSHDAFLNLFSTVYAPAYKFGQELRLACGRNEVGKIQELIARGCDPHAKDGSGWTAMHYAAEYGHVNALDAIADSLVTVKISSGNPATPEKVDVNLQDVSGWTPLVCAAANGHVEVIEKLLSLGADVYIASKEGRTALHWAATRGMDSCVTALLAAGASVDTVDRSGWSALHCAMLHGSDSCSQLLIEHNANPQLQDLLKCTPTVYESIQTAT